ncbi:MAG: hypothetical protein AMJ56_00540 [Anaerolineae bacterium SG8_19]|nr:MAG: hypothetical protein AMJ56_00540 [Anaerolineae bacterium SG8_19]
MDDLVNELRNPKGTSGSDFNATYWLGLANKAADRIYELEKELFVRGCKNWDLFVQKSSRIEALETALAHIYAWYPISVTQPHQTIHDIREFARAALGEKKDG